MRAGRIQTLVELLQQEYLLLELEQKNKDRPNDIPCRVLFESVLCMECTKQEQGYGRNDKIAVVASANENSERMRNRVHRNQSTTLIRRVRHLVQLDLSCSDCEPREHVHYRERKRPAGVLQIERREQRLDVVRTWIGRCSSCGS
jgi:hypothetical protein